MILRTYQTEAVDAALSARARGVLRPLIVLPTGAGKSLVLAEVARRVKEDGGRSLVVTHVRELVEQDAAACAAVGLDVGVCSAGLDRRDTDHDVVVAGIQTAVHHAADFGRRDVLIVDEAHRVRADGDGQYHSLIQGLRAANDQVAMVGLTATPYRTGSGMLTDGDPPLFDEVSYCAEIPPLIEQGYLSKLTSKQAASPDLRGVKTVAGDWSEDGLAIVMGGQVEANCADLVKRAADRTRVLVFCCTVEHCHQVSAELQKHGWAAPVVTGTTPDDERDYLTRAIRNGEIRCLVNCQVLTTGFDAPGIDCVALMRPTKSCGLYYQMAGRGFRVAPGKVNCMVADYGGNIVRHGPLDRLVIKRQGEKGDGPAPTKVCPNCQEVLPLAARECPCGWIAPPIEPKTTPKAANVPIIGVEILPPKLMEVRDWACKVHKSKAGSSTLRVDYMVTMFTTVSEWICFAHAGYPRLKAEEWWLRHGGRKVPATLEEARDRFAELRRPTSISVIKDGQYDRVVGRSFLPAQPVRIPGL